MIIYYTRTSTYVYSRFHRPVPLHTNIINSTASASAGRLRIVVHIYAFAYSSCIKTLQLSQNIQTYSYSSFNIRTYKSQVQYVPMSIFPFISLHIRSQAFQLTYLYVTNVRRIFLFIFYLIIFPVFSFVPRGWGRRELSFVLIQSREYKTPFD